METRKKCKSYNSSLPALADTKALLGAIINTGLHPTSHVTSLNREKMPFFFDTFPRDEFHLIWEPTFCTCRGRTHL